jgi:hypothetical protein
MTLYTRAAVFRNTLGDCTNGGVTATHTTIYIIDDEGQTLKREPDPRLVFLSRDHGGGYMALVPVHTPDGAVGPMFGGNLAISDRSKIIYRVHDRFETPEQYADTTR